MTEQIGKVVLDKTFYPGKDLYCDGSVEDELLKIVKEYDASDYDKVIEDRGSWPVLYHLSEKRANIIEWLPIDKSMKVLEVGSGCGAITSTLVKKAGSVTGIDLSLKRSSINAYRNKDADNLLIHVGNFKDVEKTLPNDYDYIFLIGVFEYAKGYMGSDTPYEDFMNILKAHLKPQGRMVIAIENLWGLKYWAGCREDHLGTYFSGLEGYPAECGVRTFTRRGLEEICKNTGVEDYHFYYPYPDYKFMTTIYSDDRLPNVGELSNNLRNFDRERLLLFDEKHVFDSVIKEDLFPLYSNSYFLLIGPKVEPVYVKYSNDRAAEYAIKTEICKDSVSGELYVTKKPMSYSAMEHMKAIKAASDSLKETFGDCGAFVNVCEEKEDGLYFEYLDGVTLEELLDSYMERKDETNFLGLLDTYYKLLCKNEAAPIKDKDLIFANILVNDGKWHVIDYEWSSEAPCPAGELFTRALYCYTLGSHRRKLYITELSDKLGQYGYSKELLDTIMEEEAAFQKKVTGQRLSMLEIRNKIGMPIVNPLDLASMNKVEPRVQVYVDNGAGFSEDNSYFIPMNNTDAVQKLTIDFPKGAVALRVDPCMEPVMLYIKEVAVVMGTNRVDVQELKPNRKGQYKRGKTGYFTNGEAIGQGFYALDTADPNVTVQYHVSEDNAKLVLWVELMKLPKSI